MEVSFQASDAQSLFDAVREYAIADILRAQLLGITVVEDGGFARRTEVEEISGPLMDALYRVAFIAALEAVHSRLYKRTSTETAEVEVRSILRELEFFPILPSPSLGYSNLPLGVEIQGRLEPQVLGGHQTEAGQAFELLLGANPQGFQYRKISSYQKRARIILSRVIRVGRAFGSRYFKDRLDHRFPEKTQHFTPSHPGPQGTVTPGVAKKKKVFGIPLEPFVGSRGADQEREAREVLALAEEFPQWAQLRAFVDFYEPRLDVLPEVLQFLREKTPDHWAYAELSSIENLSELAERVDTWITVFEERLAEAPLREGEIAVYREAAGAAEKEASGLKRFLEKKINGLKKTPKKVDVRRQISEDIKQASGAYYYWIAFFDLSDLDELRPSEVGVLIREAAYGNDAETAVYGVTPQDWERYLSERKRKPAFGYSPAVEEVATAAGWQPSVGEASKPKQVLPVPFLSGGAGASGYLSEISAGDELEVGLERTEWYRALNPRVQKQLLNRLSKMQGGDLGIHIPLRGHSFSSFAMYSSGTQYRAYIAQRGDRVFVLTCAPDSRRSENVARAEKSWELLLEAF